MAIQIVDPLEQAPPLPARYGVTADGRHGILDTRSTAVRSAYQDYFNRHHQSVAAIMRRAAIPLLQLSTAQDVVAAPRSHFAVKVVRQQTIAMAA